MNGVLTELKEAHASRTFACDAIEAMKPARAIRCGLSTPSRRSLSLYFLCVSRGSGFSDVRSAIKKGVVE